MPGKTQHKQQLKEHFDMRTISMNFAPPAAAAAEGAEAMEVDGELGAAEEERPAAVRKELYE